MLALAMTLLLTSPAVPPPRWRPTPRSTSTDEAAQAKALGLRPKGSGYQRVRKPEDRFDAFVRSDGEVEFTLDSEVVVKVDGVCAFAVCFGGKKEVQRSPTKAQRGARALGIIAALVGEAALTGGGRTGSWGYGTPRAGPIPGSQLRGPPPRMSERLGGVVGRYGHLPAPTRAMSSFMDETFEFRTELARQDAARRLEEARKDLDRTVTAIWASESSPADKRAAILGVWTDLDAAAPARDAPLGASLDALREAAAAKARVAVEASARAHAADGSSTAFTSAELAAYNANAAVPFCPYGEADCPRPTADVPSLPSASTSSNTRSQ